MSHKNLDIGPVADIRRSLFGNVRALGGGFFFFGVLGLGEHFWFWGFSAYFYLLWSESCFGIDLHIIFN